jgi:hypothetical protein
LPTPNGGTRHLESLKGQRHRLMGSHYGLSPGITGSRVSVSRTFVSGQGCL